MRLRRGGSVGGWEIAQVMQRACAVLCNTIIPDSLAPTPFINSLGLNGIQYAQLPLHINNMRMPF